MTRPTITQTNGKFPRHAIQDLQLQEDLVTNVNAHAASLDALTAAVSVTGSKASGAALTSLLTKLALLGIITDNTTA